MMIAEVNEHELTSITRIANAINSTVYLCLPPDFLIMKNCIYSPTIVPSIVITMQTML